MIWYLSWAKPADEGGWQGFCLVDVESGTEIDAVLKAHSLGINPGGNVLSMFNGSDYPVPDGWMDKLFTTEEDVRAFDVAMGGDGSVVRQRS